MHYRKIPATLFNNSVIIIESAAAAKSRQSCLTLCDPIDGSPPGSSVLGILQARTLKWVAISVSNAWKWKVKVKSLSRVRLLAVPWTGAYQAPPSMGFSSQEYWSRVPSPSPIHVAVDIRSILFNDQVIFHCMDIDIQTKFCISILVHGVTGS